MPEGISGVGRTGWSRDGRSFQFEAHRPPEGGGKAVPIVVTFDPQAGLFTEAIGPVPDYEPQPRRPSDIELTPEAKKLEGAPQRLVITWWLQSQTETESPKALVAEHAYAAIMASHSQFVAYLTEGTVYTRQILQFSVEEYRQMKLAAKRAEAMSRAKQVALAAIMYATDYDDALPANLNREILAPYAKNDKLFDGFVFTFPGGSLNKIADPANTELGHIEMDGGRMVAYMDGHVKWVPPGSSHLDADESG